MLPLILAISAAILWGTVPAQAATTEVVAIDEAVTLGPGEVRAFPIGLRRNQAVVDASFEVIRGGELTMMLLPRGGDRSVARVVSQRLHGEIRQGFSELGDYQVVLDNRRSRDRRVTAQLRVTLDFDESGLEEPMTVGPVKRTVIVGSSLLFLGLMAFWTGRRLWPAIERRRRERQLPLY